MLNGIDPIFLFNFFKLTPELQAQINTIPLVAKVVSKIGLPPIPVYLSEKLTGIYIDSESKNIDIETSTETLTDGSDPKVNQKGIGSTVTINMIANKNSIGLMLISAMAEVILPKVTSKEYSITYLHGPITVFNGLLHQFSFSQNADSTLMNLSIQLSRSTGKPTIESAVPLVSKSTGSLPVL
jgi:hypothetical protein